MSKLITAANIDLVIKKNNEIRDEVLGQTMKLQMNPAIMKVVSRTQLALLILQGFGMHCGWYCKSVGCRSYRYRCCFENGSDFLLLIK